MVAVLDIVRHFRSSEEFFLCHCLSDYLLNHQRFFVFPFMLHGGNEGSSSDFFMGPELSKLVEDGGVAQVEVLSYIFEIPVDVAVDGEGIGTFLLFLPVGVI